MIRMLAPTVLVFGLAAFGCLAAPSHQANAQEETAPLDAGLADAWWRSCKSQYIELTREQESQQRVATAVLSSSWERAVQEFLKEQDEHFADFIDDLPDRNACSFADPTQWQKKSEKWRDANFAKKRLRDLRVMECRLTDLLRSDAVPYECFSTGTAYETIQCSRRVRSDVQQAITNLRTAMNTALLDLENLLAALPTHIMLHCLNDDIATMQRAQHVLLNTTVPVHACFHNRTKN